ncbi:hypothetical protein CEG14_23570 [Bordetella genomosp. 1]|uniref:Uncharacterized protein n=1 Tax=Bordetella genomosp. 1 TaxID=1395607 RepID=A0A261RUZ6_9BORD|nr:hypothetical protein [Bordetella genomosp. 1]OZI28906.1 hypothetical protein CEG14_23570 [Bordetella genomosp. 1]
MSFDDFMTDDISVRKQNGDLLEGLKASVQRDKIFLDRSDVLIEPRDLIERRASNGAVETFEVIDPGFHEAFHGIEAHYQMSVRKLGLPEAKQRIESIIYNITGHNARINNHSVDKSTNVITIGADFRDYIDGLRQVVQSLTDAKQKQDALEIVNAVEAQLASPKPSKTVVSTLLNALPHVASIATLASAIISGL